MSPVGKPWDLRVGDWRTALADVEMVSAVICDPPYGSRTHTGNQGMRERFNGAERRDLTYAHWTPDEVRQFVAYWSPRCSGWMACMTSDDLTQVWRDAYADAGRLDFAPVPILQPRVRLGGDGPASSAVYLMVGRPRRREFLSWGALPGWYKAGIERGPESYIGGKPVSLMREIVRDYSQAGDLVVDPLAGSGSTGLAACKEGRRFVGAELDPTTALRAVKRLLHADLSPPLIPDAPRGVQLSLDAAQSALDAAQAAV